jgi:hypothetical protein
MVAAGAKQREHSIFLGAGLGLRADVAGGAGTRRGSAEKESGN